MIQDEKSATQNPKKVFITGIAGFIGFHLALHLKNRGDLVAGCDNFNDYYDPELKKERSRILKEKGISIFDSDIRNSACLEKAMLDHETTHFVHLAAQAGVRHSLTNPEVYVQSNLDGFVQVLEACRKHPHIKFIYASSSSVYGLNQKVPFSESDSTDKPASFYGATKKSNELIASAYHNVYGISVTGLRFFTVYGPWGRPDMAYFSFTQNIMKGVPIPVFNQGRMRRDFTYIDDIIQGTASAIDLGAECEIFNLGNNIAEELSELISIIERLTGKKAHQQLLPMQAGDVTVTYADISKSQTQLGYRPRVSLQEGMRRFMDWYLKQYSAASKK
jgi:UDP-glucuronate 4-epimerase